MTWLALQVRGGSGELRPSLRDPFALSLVLFGLLFSGLVALGRGAPGSNGEHGYTVFATFVLVGLYLAVLDPSVATELRLPENGAQSQTGSAGRHGHDFSDPLLFLARVVVGVGIVVTVILGSINGTSQAREVRQNRLYLGQVTVRANQYPDRVVHNLYWVWWETTQSIRRRITIARDDHLSLFATGDAAKYLSERPLQLAPLRATVVLPRDGSTVHGKQILDVVGSDSFDVTGVDYFLSGPGLAGSSLATGARTNYGWIATWNTSTVPNGNYRINATVEDSGGRSVRIGPVEVRVENESPPTG